MQHFANFDLIMLFFALGVFASWIRSDLEIPDTISTFLSIFLLLSLGLKGGHEVRMAQDLSGFLPALFVGLSSCFVIPFVLFWVFRGRLGFANAAALAASYGSVSAVTFITAQGILEKEALVSSGYMVAVMALMEIPAILIGVYLYQKYAVAHHASSGSILKYIFSAKSVVLLLGGFVIGFSMNQLSWDGISPVVQGAFKGVLAFFLLDLGVLAQKQMPEAWQYRLFAFLIAIVFPLAFGTAALAAGSLLGLSRGDQILLAVLAGSASYIAAPAAIRASVPTANPSLYLALPLGLTFPMNLLLGIPFYIGVSQLF